MAARVGEDPRRRRALRPDRAHLPRDGARAAAAARAGGARRGGDGGARARRPTGSGAPTSTVVLDLPARAAAGARRRRPAAPGGGEPRRQRPAGADRAAGAAPARGPRLGRGRRGGARGRRQRARHGRRRWRAAPSSRSSPPSRRASGTGVGLSVCHGIVAAHGGRIELDTAAGEGARFRVRAAAVARAPRRCRPVPAAPHRRPAGGCWWSTTSRRSRRCSPSGWRRTG